MGLVIVIEPHGTYAIYEQIVNQIKNQIISGELQPDEALPSIRGLAADIGVSVITTKHAYEELERVPIKFLCVQIQHGLSALLAADGVGKTPAGVDYAYQNRRDLELRIFVRCWRSCCKMESIIFSAEAEAEEKRYSAKSRFAFAKWILNFQSGYIIEIIGENGAGKTTFFRYIWRKSIIAAAFIWTEPISRKIGLFRDHVVTQG